MKMHPGTRTRILAEVTLDFDPADASMALKVDRTWYPCTWQGPATSSGGKWTRHALTDRFFAGRAHPNPDGAVVLSAGPHPTETRVSTATGDITASSEPVDVDYQAP